MLSFFLDASALSKRYFPEKGSQVVNHLFASVKPDRYYVFNVSIAEVVSVLTRKRNTDLLSVGLFAQALADVGNELVTSASIHRIIAGDAQVNAALQKITTHSLNATDAIILQAALTVANHLRLTGDDLVLVAADQRLLRAAQAEGLQTFDPENQDQAALDGLLGP